MVDGIKSNKSIKIINLNNVFDLSIDPEIKYKITRNSECNTIFTPKIKKSTTKSKLK